MHNLGFALDGAWHVLLAGLLLGAGLPVLFALGVRSLAWADAGGPARPLGRLAGVTLFAVVIIGVVLGITFIVASGFGNKLSFEHVYPTIVPRS